MGPTWGPSGADRTQVGPILAPWTLLSRVFLISKSEYAVWKYGFATSPLEWRHTSVMAYKITDNSSVHCLFHSLLGLKTKGTSKILITGPLWEESLVTQLFVPKYFLALWVESSKWPVGGPHPCHYSDTTWMSQYNEYWPHDCLFHSLFRLTTKLRINGPLWVEPSEWPVTGCPSPLSLQWCHTSVSAHKIQTTRLFVPQHVWANNKQNIKSCITGPL